MAHLIIKKKKIIPGPNKKRWYLDTKKNLYVL